jgi:peptide-methionine (S)-S-oxide reductase
MKGMLHRIGFVILLTGLMACKHQGQSLQSKAGFAVVPAAGKGQAVATFAGGCFWAMQECMIELKGVQQAISVYAGGNTPNPTYQQVLTGATGHAEAVQVYYDPQVISFEQLATAFFAAHDPTQVDRQGPDVGTDYRSIAFFRDTAEYKVISLLIDKINSSKQYKDPVATEILPFRSAFGAEMEHQDYYPNNRLDAYIRQVSEPKVLGLRKKLPQLIKKEYLD